MGPRRASGWILARFATVLGGFGEGSGKVWEGLGRFRKARADFAFLKIALAFVFRYLEKRL